jgi:hypothetical protein
VTDLFAYSARLRDSGMANAAMAQDRAMPEWRELAYQAIVLVASRQPTVHANDIAEVFKIEPEHCNAWGSIWMRAIRNRVIERSGEYRHCTDLRKRLHVSPVYHSLVFRD